MMPEARQEFFESAAWWSVDTVLLRIVEDLIIGELRLLRPGGCSNIHVGPWDPTLDLGRDLGIDSLERLAIASTLSETLHVSESGIHDYFLARTTLYDWAAIAQTSLRAYSQRLTFRTSGSTGTPKACTHALASLEQEITELAPEFRGCTRIVSAVPSHHIYGFLWTVLLPWRLGIADIPVLNVRDSSPASVPPLLRPGDLVIGHPEFWRHVARVGHRFPAGVCGVTSTGPLPDGVGRQLTKFGLDRLVQIFGSSETAGVGWRDDEQRGYRLFSYWRRPDSPGGSLERRLPDGHWVVPTLVDRLEWITHNEFLPSGRIDLAVQVGGTNVFPGRVREILVRHPQVADATVRLMRPDEGHRLKAFIVTKDDQVDVRALRTQIDEWAARHLSPPEMPRALCFGRDLPRDVQGKVSDWVIEPNQH